MIKQILTVAVVSLSINANAAIIYKFDFTNLKDVTGGTGADFSLSLTYSDYVTTTGMAALPGAPLQTTLGYSVRYAGTNSLGWWGFSNDTSASINDWGFSFGTENSAFMFQPYDGGARAFFTGPGIFYGRISGNAPTSFGGQVRLTITDTNVPLPSTFWLFSSALGIARLKKATHTFIWRVL